MTKLSLLAPLLTGISALVLVFNSFGSDEKRRRETGVIVRAAGDELILKNDRKTLAFAVTSATRLHLNDRVITLAEVENGRRASVVFTKSKAQLVAQSVDIFPVPRDFDQADQSV